METQVNDGARLSWAHFFIFLETPTTEPYITSISSFLHNKTSWAQNAFFTNANKIQVQKKCNKKIVSQFVKIKPKHLLNDSQLGHKKKLGKEKMQNMNPKLQMNYITQEKPIYIDLVSPFFFGKATWSVEISFHHFSVPSLKNQNRKKIIKLKIKLLEKIKRQTFFWLFFVHPPFTFPDSQHPNRAKRTSRSNSDDNESRMQIMWNLEESDQKQSDPIR